MLITKETDYALRILRTLSSGDAFTASDLAERESLPQQFAYKILKKLEKAEIIKISRGSSGGCSLIIDLKTISLLELIGAVETNAFLSTCMKHGYKCEWREKRKADCKVHHQLEKVQKKIDEQLQACSLHWVLFGDE
ncbi:MAG: Rrf2 family transcriptional regulator [Lachnospiraceae bacterium]|nr:Rrf2 family transcriptional regulator [Lachnospiraceae bacterium]